MNVSMPLNVEIMTSESDSPGLGVRYIKKMYSGDFKWFKIGRIELDPGCKITLSNSLLSN